jgi:hypothetical protein
MSILWERHPMPVDPFTERLARVRHRFVSSLEKKIDETFVAVPDLSGPIPAAPEAVAEAYRRVHGIVGIGPTVGLPATGRAARSVEDVLRSPYRDGRGLTAVEISLLTTTLLALREVAARELQLCQSSPE